MTGFLGGSLIGVGQGGVDTGDIQKSLRFAASRSTYLSRTPSVTGNRKTWTWSGWIKRGALSSAGIRHTFFLSGTTEYVIFYFETDDALVVAMNNGVLSMQKITTMVFRDPSAHFHLTVSTDTTIASALARTKVYVNGVEVTSFSVDVNGFAQNYDTFMSNTVLHTLGTNQLVANWYFDGHLSRVCFVDGQALTPSSFGYQNTEINEWVSKSQSAVKAVVDAGGANSFMLDFDDGSTLTTLGYDKSSKGNNWTLNNHSLTAGVNYDWMDDVPGNSFATWNTLDKGTSLVIAEGGTLVGVSGTALQTVRTTISLPSSGDFYAEVTAGINTILVGVAKSEATLLNWLGSDANGWSYNSNNGQKYNNGSGSAYGATYTTGDVIGIKFSSGAGSLEFLKNNVSQGVAFTGLSGQLFISVGCVSFMGSTYINFGQRPFAYTPPTGFKALSQRNLPTPSILKPNLHFDVKLHTGNGATQSVTGVSFKPDLVWIKGRNVAYSHVLTDSVRGAQLVLYSDLTSAEAGTTYANVSSFNVDGFSLGTTSSTNITNGSTVTYADWLWKAGGAAVTNTAGSISSQVSANTAAGFSIVTYTGTGANATVGHGLGVAPKMVITKQRGSTGNWGVYHSGLTSATYAVWLNSTNPQGSQPIMWNSTAPSSTVFSIGTTNTDTNTSAGTFVAYCFAEIAGYSKIGSYTGNGSTDGPFVHCGFKPRFVLIKRTDAGAEGWIQLDTARDTYNVEQLYLLANSSGVEATLPLLDAVATGFKLRTNGASGGNVSGATYVFYVVAETTGKYSNAK
jgi:hypothetical protein